MLNRSALYQTKAEKQIEKSEDRFFCDDKVFNFRVTLNRVNPTPHSAAMLSTELIRGSYRAYAFGKQWHTLWCSFLSGSVLSHPGGIEMTCFAHIIGGILSEIKLSRPTGPARYSGPSRSTGLI